MKLFYSPGACSLSPHIVALELGLDLELVKVDLKSGKTEKGEIYKDIVSKGFVPALLLDDGKCLTEGVAIVQYLASLKPEAKLVPAQGTFAFFQCVEMLNFISTEIHKGLGAFWNEKLVAVAKPILLEKLTKNLKVVETILSNNKFLLGDSFTVCDAYLFTVLSWAKPLQIDLSSFPKIGAYLNLLSSKPCIVKALQAEGLLKQAA